METWRRTWREAIAPQLSTPGLEALAAALVEDDPRLVQLATCYSADGLAGHAPVCAACAIGYAAWQGDGLDRVGEVQLYFAEVVARAGQALGEESAARWFLNWFDETPRDRMRPALLAEVRLEVSRRLPLAAA